MKIKQKFYKLSNVEKAALKTRRKLMERAVPAVNGEKMNFLTRLSLIDKVITGKIRSDTGRPDLVGLNIILGDVFVHEMGFHWVMVDDVYGRDFAIRYGDTRITINPRTLISKLVDQEGDVRVDEIYMHVSENVCEMLMGDPYIRSIDVPIVHPLLKAESETMMQCLSPFSLGNTPPDEHQVVQ